MTEKTNNEETGQKKMFGLKARLELETRIEQLETENTQLKYKASQLEALHQIGRSITAMSDLDEILIEIVEAAVGLTEADEGTLMLPDEQKEDELLVRAQKGLQEKTAQRLKLKVNDSAAGFVFSTGEAVNLSQETRLVTGYIVHAIIYVPLKYGEKILGVLSVDNRENKRYFSEDDKYLLSGLADYAAIALENGRLVNSLSNRNQILTSLHTTVRSIISASSLKTVLDGIVKNAVGALEADVVVLYEYDEHTDDIIMPPTIAGELWQPEVLRNRGVAIPHKQSIVFELIYEKEPFYATKAKEDWFNSPLYSRFKSWAEDGFLSREGIVSSGAIPLIANKEIVGVMFINFRKPHQFDDREKDKIELFSSHAAIAIQDAKLRRENERRIGNLAGLLDTSPIINVPPVELRDVLKSIVDNAKKVIGCDYTLLMLYDKQTGQFRGDFITTSGIPDEMQPTIKKPRLTGTTAQVLEKGRVVITDVEDMKQYPFIQTDPESFMARARVKSLVGVRLKMGEDKMGVLYADYCVPRVFRPDELQLLELFADQAAIVIYNAQLLAGAQRHTDELSALNEIGQAISYSLTLETDQILQLIYEQTGRLMEVKNFFIAVYDKENDLVSFKFAVENGKPAEIGRNEWADRKAGNGMTEYLIRLGRPLLVKEAVTEWLYTHGVDLMGRLPKSWVGSPLVTGKDILGVVGVQSYEGEYIYDEGHRDVLATIASQAAIAIENARLLQERKLGLEELTTLHNISLDITKKLELGPLLQTIVERAATLLKSPRGVLLRRVSNEPELMVQFTHNLDIMKGKRFKFGQGLAGHIAQTGEPIIINDYHHWENRDIRFDDELYKNLFKAAVGVPLKQQKEVIGILVVYDTAEGKRYNKNDVQLLERLANFAVIAIQNAELFNQKVHELDERVKELQALREADKALLSTMEVGETLEIILEKIADFVEYDCTVIRLWNEEKAVLVLEKYKGNYPGKIPVNLRLGMGVSGRAAFKKEGERSDDVRRDPDHLRLIEVTEDLEEKKYLHWVRSEVAVPLIAKGNLVGLLTVQSLKKASFKEPDIQLLDGFSGQAAIALHNAQLIQQSRQHTVLVAHQLKGPLQAIRGDVDYQLGYIGQKFGGDERLEYFSRRIREHFGRLKKELDNFSFLVRDSLGVSHKFTMDMYSLTSIIQESVAQFKETAKHRGIIIEIDPSIQTLPRIYIDRENMFTVFTNLIENAVKYSHDNKTVDITGQRHGSKVIVTISDFGLGVLPQDREVIFELYKQGKFKDKRRFIQGTGIGLWVAKEIIKAHGGKIFVWSSLFDCPELISSGQDVVDRGFKTKFTVELLT